jgi:alpha-1,2-mannosyltransferase
MEKKRLVLWLSVFLFFLALGQQFYKLFFVWQQNNFIDFKVYWDAARAVLIGGSVYSFGDKYLNNIPFNYPPTALFFLLLLPLFSQSVSSLFLFFLSLGSLLGSLYLLTKMFFKPAQKWLVFFLSSVLFIQFFPTKFTWTLGQINLIILFLIVLSFYLYQKKRDIFSGLFLGIATLIKIFPGFLIFFFLKEKKWKTIVSFLVTCLGGILLTVLIFKPVLFFNYFGQIGADLFFKGGEISYFDQSLNSFLLRLNLSNLWRLSLRLIFTFVSLWMFLKTTNKALSYFGLIFSLLIFLPSFAWFHHYVILIPLMMFLWSQTKKKDYLPRILLALVYILVSFHFRYPEVFPGKNIILTSHPFFGFLLLWFYSLKLSFKKNRKK